MNLNSLKAFSEFEKPFVEERHNFWREPQFVADKLDRSTYFAQPPIGTRGNRHRDPSFREKQPIKKKSYIYTKFRIEFSCRLWPTGVEIRPGARISTRTKINYSTESSSSPAPYAFDKRLCNAMMRNRQGLINPPVISRGTSPPTPRRSSV